MEYNLAKNKMRKYLFLLTIVSLFLGVLMPLSSNASVVNNDNTAVINDGGYFSGVFKATDDDWSCVITFKSDGSFVMVEREGQEVEPTVYGTYSLTDKIVRGQMSDINLYVNGEYIGGARLAWPLEEDMCLILDGYVFKKQ